MNQSSLRINLPARAVRGWCLAILAAFVAVTPVLLAWTPVSQQAPKLQAPGEVQDFVFLAEARPILVRFRVQVDGGTVQAGYDAFVKHLFSYLDVDGNGVLSKAEAERMPPVEQMLSGTLTTGFSALISGGGPARPTIAEPDAGKDGKVTLAELTADLRGKGFTPFQTQLDAKQANPFAMAMGGGAPQLTVGAIGDAIFSLLDTDGDGQLSREELAAAPVVLLRKDENEDDLITPRELVPNNGGSKAGGAGMMAFPTKAETPDNPYMVMVDADRNAPDLLKRFQARYAKDVAAADMKLSRTVLGLDEKSFAALDTNGDGVVDAKELTGFVKRTPDVELVLRLGTRALTEKPVQVLTSPGIRFVNNKTRDHFAMLELGATRVELRGYDSERPDRLGGIVRTQFLAQFKQADKGGKGLNEQQAKSNPLFGKLFKTMDRDGDGIVTEGEFVAYLDTLEDLKKRARAACVTLVVEDQSRGLFDLLDTDRDGRLSVREMRGAERLLQELGCVGKGFLTKADLPRSYLLKLRRGPATPGGIDLSEVFEQAYQGTYEGEASSYATAGPVWFRKMDRNRDGDVSRKEFLGTDEQFHAIDTDGDGLISVAEAERYDALRRKKE